MHSSSADFASGKLGIALRDVMALRTCPIDENGYFNFGINNRTTYEQAVNAKLVIVEKNALGVSPSLYHIKLFDIIKFDYLK